MTKEDIKKYEDILNNEAKRYLFFLSLNPIQGFKKKEEYEKSLNTFKELKENLKEFNLDKKVKKESLDFIKKGITLMYRAIHDFK